MPSGVGRAGQALVSSQGPGPRGWEPPHRKDATLETDRDLEQARRAHEI